MVTNAEVSGKVIKNKPLLMLCTKCVCYRVFPREPRAILENCQMTANVSNDQILIKTHKQRGTHENLQGKHTHTHTG